LRNRLGPGAPPGSEGRPPLPVRAGGAAARRGRALGARPSPALSSRAMKLNADPHALRGQYVAAHPFPHIVLDGLFPPEVLDGVLADFPRPEEMRARFDN